MLYAAIISISIRVVSLITSFLLTSLFGLSSMTLKVSSYGLALARSRIELNFCVMLRCFLLQLFVFSHNKSIRVSDAFDDSSVYGFWKSIGTGESSTIRPNVEGSKISIAWAIAVA